MHWKLAYNVEGGHGISELQVLVIQTVGVVGPGAVRGGCTHQVPVQRLVGLGVVRGGVHPPGACTKVSLTRCS